MEYAEGKALDAWVKVILHLRAKCQRLWMKSRLSLTMLWNTAFCMQTTEQ